MKNYKLLAALAVSVLVSFSYNANAATIDITPDGVSGLLGGFGDYTGCPNDVQCWTGTDNSNLDASEIQAYIEFDPTQTLIEYYKADVGEVTLESGDYASQYDTVFTNTSTDPQDATITFGGDSAIDCTVCFLYVKDGNQDPAFYIFDITSWNGTDELNLTGFWPNQGAISHVALYGVDDVSDRSIVPIPAAAWLFGSGLIGLVGVARRKT